MTQQVTIGKAEKADCSVTASPADKLQVVVKTKNASMLKAGIESVVAGCVEQFGRDIPAALEVLEGGSLNWVITARTECALRTLRPELAPLTPMTVTRQEVARDRLRRTRLYAPGNNPRLLLGVELHGADVLLLDLEDSVPPANKFEARILVKHMLGAVDFDEVWVRINPLDTYGVDDLAEVMRCRPHGICLPKAESARDVQRLSGLLAEWEDKLGIPRGSTFIVPIVETARGILRAEEIVSADARVIQVAFGAEDYTRDVGAQRTDASLLTARSLLVLAAKAHGVQASDTVFSDVEDDEGLLRETRLAWELGFDGKGTINPRQIDPIHSVFDPSDSEIAQAVRIVAAAKEAEEKGLGAIAIGGKMVDKPVLERARRTLHLAALAHKEVVS